MPEFPIANFPLPIVAGCLFATLAFAQESAAPSATEAVSASPSPTAIASVAPTRRVALHFVPPPLEGTVTLGIFDSNDKLVRVLHREAKIETFTVEENSLGTTWDGKDDSGADLPSGKYRARGFMVSPFNTDDLGNNPAPSDASDHVSIKLVTNPLVSDTRSIVDVAAGFDPAGDFLKTTDGLPLFTINQTPNLIRVSIRKNGEKAIDVWQEDGSSTKQIRVSNVDKMMAFDCGFFELK
jgi:hypothetical protein